jgi:predicted Zn-dependent protease
MLLTEDDARALTARILGFVKGDDAAVSVLSENYSHLRFAANNFLTSGRKENVTATVTAWIGRRRGAASTNDLSDAALAEAVTQAEALARVSPVDVEYLPTLEPQTYRPTAGYADATANVPLPARARQIDEAIAASVKAGLISAGFHQISLSATAEATRHGNFQYERSSLVSLAMSARTRDGGSSGYFLRNHFDAARLDTARISREAIRRALESREAKPLPAGTYPVILEPQAVADLLSSTFLFDARSADEGRSPFSGTGGRTRLGDQVFDPKVNLVSDPWRPELPGPAAARSGLPAQVLHLVRNGVLENLVYSRFWAQQKKTTPTPGPVNLILEPTGPGTSLDAMIEATPRALLVGRFWYIRMVDPRAATVTGLTRDGVWLIENGRIAHPVRNFRFNQSIVQMLAPGNVEMIGVPERVGGSENQGSNPQLLPALRLAAFHFTSQSEAV